LDEYIRVLDKMIERETREAFLERKRSSYNTKDSEIGELERYILSDDCERDIERLRQRDFYFEAPRRVLLRKKNSDKRRAVYRFRPEESMIIKLMAFVMHDHDYLFSDSLYSFRIGRPIAGIFRHIRKQGYNRTHWVLKTDIHSFGDNVDADILMEQLTDIYKDKDPDLLWFFDRLLTRGEYYEKGELVHGNTGALSGCALTNFFENVYLLDVDDIIREHASYYCRFADDIAVFTETEEQAREAYRILGRKFKERGLEFNEDKTAITSPGERFELLGFQLENGEFDIAETSMRKVEWKFRHFADKLLRWQAKYGISREESMQRMIDRIDRYFFGMRRDENELNWVDWAFGVLTRPDSLRRLDSCAQDCIRIAGSGKKTNAKYRVRYKEMQRRGYRTLVHAYYHGFERREE
jgi:hypothetical protein